jgi:hypothetical protein
MTARTKKLGSTPQRQAEAAVAKLAVWVQPGAKRTEIVGFVAERNAWHVRLAARATDNQANLELVASIAQWLEVPQKQVVIAAGHTSRGKLLRVEGIDDPCARQRLSARAADKSERRT